MKDRQRILVTGAAGFVGTALTNRLLRDDEHEVTAVVRRGHGLHPNAKLCHVADIGDDTDLRTELEGCHAVVHLAARVHIMQDRAVDPLKAYRKTNVNGTLALARQAADSGVRRLVFASSVKVNGENTVPGHPFRETDEACPVDPYGVSKHEAELGLFEIAKAGSMDIVVIRPPLVYGPGVQANFQRMVRWLAKGIPLPLGAVRNNRRSLIGIDNLVDLVVTCLHHPAAVNEVFFASDGEDLSTADLLRRTAIAMGVRPRLVPVPVSLLSVGGRLLGKRDLLDRLCGNLQVDITKAQKTLGWKPPVTVNEGLRRAVTG